MLKETTLHVACALVAGATALMPSHAAAQEWSVRSGGTARVEFNDNYFFTPTDTQSGLTASITPFVTAVRRTEASEVAAARRGRRQQSMGSLVERRLSERPFRAGRLGARRALHLERKRIVCAIPNSAERKRAAGSAARARLHQLRLGGRRVQLCAHRTLVARRIGSGLTTIATTALGDGATFSEQPWLQRRWQRRLRVLGEHPGDVNGRLFLPIAAISPTTTR